LKISGTIFEVTNAAQFVPSYLAGTPKAGTFKPLAGLRVNLGSDFPAGFGLDFVPKVSAQAKTDSKGAFSVALPAGVPRSAQAYLMAMREVAVAPIPLPFSVFAPLYRSATMKNDRDRTGVKIYLLRQTGTPAQGVSQQTINAEVAKARKAGNLSKLQATIVDGGISVRGSARGADVTFKMLLRPITSHNLDELVGYKLRDFDVDLPGPDFIVGICVSENDIKKRVNSHLKGIVRNMNTAARGAIVDAVAKMTGLPKAQVQALFADRVSMTCEAVRTPIVKSIKVAGFTLHERAVTVDPVFGFPRSL
jgi:hypothetical protein